MQTTINFNFPQINLISEPLVKLSYATSIYFGRHIAWVESKIFSDYLLESAIAKIWSIAFPILVGATLVFIPQAINSYSHFKRVRAEAKFIKEIKILQKSILEDNELKTLFKIVNNQSDFTIKEYFDRIGLEQRNVVMNKLISKYRELIQWMKELGSNNVEENINSRVLNQRISTIIDKLYGNYAKVVGQIATSYQELLGNEVRELICTGEFYPCTNIMPKGIQSLIEIAKEKNRITAPIIVCGSYQDYANKLTTSVRSDGKYYFIIRCKEKNIDHEIHISAILVEKQNNLINGFILDSGGIYVEIYRKFIMRISQLTLNFYPTAVLNTTNLTRQYDGYNCGFMAFKAIKSLSKLNEDALSLYYQESEKQVNNSELGELASILKINSTLPLSLVKPIQSLTKLNSLLDQANPNDPHYKKLIHHRNTFTLIDPRSNTPSYQYSKLHALKYRLEIIARTFLKES